MYSYVYKFDRKETRDDFSDNDNYCNPLPYSSCSQQNKIKITKSLSWLFFIVHYGRHCM